MIFADAPLARRLEAAEAAIAKACRGPGSAAAEIAGGCAIFAGAESPLTQAVALGLNGPVSPAELDRLEAFFHGRGAPARLDLCPLADPGLIDDLAGRGYRVAEFNNVLVRALPGSEIPPTPRVRAATPSDRDLWSHTVGQGFFEQPDLTDAEMDIGRVIFDMPGAACYFTVTESGRPTGGGAMAVHDSLAILFSDTTLPGWRRLGLHRELISARLHDAVVLNCTLATASTLPGSASQRNYERLGFQVAYTKVALIR